MRLYVALLEALVGFLLYVALLEALVGLLLYVALLEALVGLAEWFVWTSRNTLPVRLELLLPELAADPVRAATLAYVVDCGAFCPAPNRPSAPRLPKAPRVPKAPREP